MAIKILTDDALSLREQGKYLSALTLLLAAIAASSRKCFDHPKRIKGRPWGVRNDGDAFCDFLGKRIRVVLHGPTAIADQEYGTSGILITLNEEQYSVERILYKFYRCELLHEGQLPENARFEGPDHGLCISLDNDSLSFGYGLIDILAEAISDAPCNGKEFGKTHYRLRRLDDFEFERIVLEMKSRWPGSESRIFVFEDIISNLGLKTLTESTDAQLTTLVKNAVEDRHLNGGMIATLIRRNLCHKDYTLTDSGVAALRILLPAYETFELVFD